MFGLKAYKYLLFLFSEFNHVLQKYGFYNDGRILSFFDILLNVLFPQVKWAVVISNSNGI